VSLLRKVSAIDIVMVLGIGLTFLVLTVKVFCPRRKIGAKVNMVIRIFILMYCQPITPNVTQLVLGGH
jgi:hypothetical protein